MTSLLEPVAAGMLVWGKWRNDHIDWSRAPVTTLQFPGRAPVYAGQLRRLGNQHEVGEQTGEQTVCLSLRSEDLCGL